MDKNIFLDDFLEQQQEGFNLKLQTYGYNIVDGGNTKAIYSNEDNKSKITFYVIYDKNNDKNFELFADFIDCNDNKFKGNSFYLGNQDKIVLDDIFNIILSDDFIEFINNKSLSLEKYILNENKDFFNILKNKYKYDLHCNQNDFIILQSRNNLLQIHINRDLESMDISYNIFNFRSEKIFENDFKICDINTILVELETEEYIRFVDSTLNKLSDMGNKETKYGTKTQEDIAKICLSVSDLLIYKNQKYGNSAIEPLNVFYKGNNENSILIRLDDKLSRIKNNEDDIRVNDICDTIGYLVLLLVSKGVKPEDIEKLKD